METTRTILKYLGGRITKFKKKYTPKQDNNSVESIFTCPCCSSGLDLDELIIGLLKMIAIFSKSDHSNNDNEQNERPIYIAIAIIASAVLIGLIPGIRNYLESRTNLIIIKKRISDVIKRKETLNSKEAINRNSEDIDMSERYEKMLGLGYRNVMFNMYVPGLLTAITSCSLIAATVINEQRQKNQKLANAVDNIPMILLSLYATSQVLKNLNDLLILRKKITIISNELKKFNPDFKELLAQNIEIDELKILKNLYKGARDLQDLRLYNGTSFFLFAAGASGYSIANLYNSNNYIIYYLSLGLLGTGIASSSFFNNFYIKELSFTPALPEPDGINNIDLIEDYTKGGMFKDFTRLNQMALNQETLIKKYQNPIRKFSSNLTKYSFFLLSAIIPLRSIQIAATNKQMQLDKETLDEAIRYKKRRLSSLSTSTQNDQFCNQIMRERDMLGENNGAIIYGNSRTNYIDKILLQYLIYSGLAEVITVDKIDTEVKQTKEVATQTDQSYKLVMSASNRDLEAGVPEINTPPKDRDGSNVAPDDIKLAGYKGNRGSIKCKDPGCKIDHKIDHGPPKTKFSTRRAKISDYGPQNSQNFFGALALSREDSLGERYPV